MKISTVIIILVVIAAIVGSKFIFFKKEEQPAAGGGPGAKPATGVLAQIVKTSKLDNVIFATGSVIANESTDLHPETSGIIKQLLFKEGSAVEKNALLVKINDAELQAQLSKLNSDLTLAKQKEQRTKQLLDKDGVSIEEFDDAKNRVVALESDINYTKALIAKTEIRAPFSGIIGLRNVSEGSFVNQQTVIATLQQLNPVKVEFAIPDNYSGKIKTGDEIRFTASGSTEEFSGKVFAIEPRVDENTRTLRMRALCANESGKLLPGSFARIQLIMNTSANAILIPTESVVPILKGKQVFISKNGLAAAVKIETGFRNDTAIEVLTGLNAGDTLITSGLMQLKPDAVLKFISVK